MKRYLNKIHYSKALSLQEKILTGLLAVNSIGYSVGINLRNLLYSKNILKKSSLPAYIISIGNLTTGGTGKTPLTIEIANYIKNNLNKKVAVLSHGYGGKLPVKGVNIVSNESEVLIPSHLAGDEPYLMAARLDKIPVLTGRSRFNTGKYAIENFGTEVLILDDGFQHIKLERNLNILVIDGSKRFGNNLLLPAGPLREPISEIKRADKIIIVNKEPFNQAAQDSCIKYMYKLRKKFDKLVFMCEFTPDKIYNIQTSEPLQSSDSAFAFTAIAQPEFFFNYLKEQKINLAATREFTDHHLYTGNDLVNIMKEAKKLNIDSIITTEKDAVKLLSLAEDFEIPIFALKLKVNLDLKNLIGEI